MVVIITGASGLIGSVLLQNLIEEDIIALDIRPPKSKISGVKYVNQRVGNYRIPPNVTGVIHLAAVSRVITAEQDPTNAYSVNIVETQKLLHQLENLQVKPWVIYASSREVYGETGRLNITEDEQLDPINHYGISKVAAESLMKSYSRQGGNIHVLRFSNVYGGLHDHPDRVVPKFIINALLGRTLELQGKNNAFDFTHVSDTVAGILLSMKYLEGLNSSNYFEEFNICTGRATSLKQLADCIIKLTYSSSKVTNVDGRKYDVKSYTGSWAKAKKVLNYTPRVPLKQGLEEYISLLKQGLIEVKR